MEGRRIANLLAPAGEQVVNDGEEEREEQGIDDVQRKRQLRVCFLLFDCFGMNRFGSGNRSPADFHFRGKWRRPAEEDPRADS